jgi:hypothetical protein
MLLTTILQIINPLKIRLRTPERVNGRTPEGRKTTPLYFLLYYPERVNARTPERWHVPTGLLKAFQTCLYIPTPTVGSLS